ncbi:MAG: D-alanyl-D-alanine carboxypeptidase [Chloroflexi bacterium]|nr:D-alanyl-D-alanine carboxypeptidase [Chloroflexota bacterium]
MRALAKQGMPLTLMLALLFTFIRFAPAGAALPVPQVNAASAILIDSSSDTVLYSLHPDERRAMASTTKMMTALIVADRLNFEDKVTVGPEIESADGSGLELTVGETLTVKELFYSMLLMSSNDAAAVLAEKVAGGIPAFTMLMNEKAGKMGLKNTRYVNPHGLDAPGHYSTARDLATIARTLLKNPVASEAVSTKSWAFPRKGALEQLKNSNLLLGFYPFATGVKTGHTDNAGYCLVSSAKKNGRELISVILGADSDEAATSISGTLLDYGFSLYSVKPLTAKGQIFEHVKLPYERTLNIIAGKSLMAEVREGAPIKKELSLSAPKGLPVAKGSRFGRIVFEQDGRVLGSVDLIADGRAAPPTLAERLAEGLRAAGRALGRLFAWI